MPQVTFPTKDARHPSTALDLRAFKKGLAVSRPPERLLILFLVVFLPSLLFAYTLERWFRSVQFRPA